jgi:hypothetical protein
MPPWPADGPRITDRDTPRVLSWSGRIARARGERDSMPHANVRNADHVIYQMCHPSILATHGAGSVVGEFGHHQHDRGCDADPSLAQRMRGCQSDGRRDLEPDEHGAEGTQQIAAR